MKSKLVGSCAALLLAACQPTLEAQVTHFSTAPFIPRGETFVVLPDKDQAGSLEFQHYATFVTGALQNYGLRPVLPPGPDANLVVQFHYRSSGAQTNYWYDPGPYFGSGWYGPRWWGWGGYYGGTVNSYTVYFHDLDVEILDGPAWRSGERRTVFEGRAEGQSDVRSLNETMPALVRALFTNFPGANGRTMQVDQPIGG